jgi:hypothetical protein
MRTDKMSFEQSIDFFVKGDCRPGRAIYESPFRVRLPIRLFCDGSESGRDPNSPPAIRWVVPQLLLISTRIVFGLATSFFDSVTVKTPLLYSALTLSTSTLSGSVKARTKEP